MAFTDAIWSHYAYVKARILAKNPNRVVAGILDAQDWPSKPVKFEAFYLLTLGDTPIGRQGYSQYSPMLFHQMQWVWINKGTDLQQGTRAANRGDRFVNMENMKGELLYGLAPGFTMKLNWSLVTGVFTGTSPAITEAITWNPVQFHNKFDKESGLEYGAGALRIWNMTDAITS